MLKTFGLLPFQQVSIASAVAPKNVLTFKETSNFSWQVGTMINTVSAFNSALTSAVPVRLVIHFRDGSG